MAAAKTGRVNYDKGLDLEMRFCEFMKTELGYREATIRRHVKSKVDSKGTQVDIIGERNDSRGKQLHKLFVIYLITCAIFLAAGVYFNNTSLSLFGLLVEFAGVFAWYLSFKYKVEHAWVECKNQDTEKVNISQIRKAIDCCKDYKDTKDDRFRFNQQYFVSASGFNEDAYSLAKSKGVYCYIVKNGNFVEATYWNINDTRN